LKVFTKFILELIGSNVSLRSGFALSLAGMTDGKGLNFDLDVTPFGSGI
jgi:hypothetical protein